MPIPLIPVVIVAGAAIFAGRKAHDALADHPDLKGFCSNCGKTCNHEFHESGMSWKKAGITGVLLGALGLGVSSLLVRNVYKCRSCGHLVLPCRTPGCKGMALSAKAYDDEFCGQCYSSNDKSQFHSAVNDRKQREKLKKILATMQEDRDKLKVKLAELQKDRSSDKKLIKDLLEVIRRKDDEISRMRQNMAA